MAGSAFAAVQAAVHSRLWADATLLGLTGTHATEAGKARVYDEPPENAALPYVVIGDAVENHDNRMGGKVGRVVDFFVHVWSDYRGNKEAQDIESRVDALLDNYTDLSVSGYTVNLLSFQDRNLNRYGTASRPLRESISRYRIDILETA